MERKKATPGTRETVVELDRRLVDLEKKVRLLEVYFGEMQERAADLEALAEKVTKHAKKEKDLSNLTDTMVGHGQMFICLNKYLFGLLHAVRKKCEEEFNELATMCDMQSISHTLKFKETVLSLFPDLGLSGADLPLFLCILDTITHDKILSSESEAGMFIKIHAMTESSPLGTLGSQDDLAEGEKEVRDLFKFIASRKLDKKTRGSLRRIVAAGQCSRTSHPVKDFPDPFLVKDILGFK